MKVLPDLVPVIVYPEALWTNDIVGVSWDRLASYKIHFDGQIAWAERS